MVLAYLQPVGCPFLNLWHFCSISAAKRLLVKEKCFFLYRWMLIAACGLRVKESLLAVIAALRQRILLLLSRALGYGMASPSGP